MRAAAELLTLAILRCGSSRGCGTIIRYSGTVAVAPVKRKKKLFMTTNNDHITNGKLDWIIEGWTLGIH